jgi:hypothetical protein
MTKKNIRYIAILAAFVAMFTTLQAQAQCDWQVTAVATPSACAASGRVEAKLAGADTASITNLQFRLQSLTSSFQVPQSASRIFENLPPDDYMVVARGICNGHEDSVSCNVTVTGNYITVTAGAQQQRSALKDCNTGQETIFIDNGLAPYTVDITSKPADYTGPTHFTTSNSRMTLDSLTGGVYNISVSDGCGTTTSVFSFTVTELAALNASQFGNQQIDALDSSCNRFYIKAPYWSVSGENYYSAFTYSWSYNGGTQSAYMPMGSRLQDTIVLPAGQEFKDAYGKAITYHIKGPCGQDLVYNVLVQTPGITYSSVISCDGDFDMTVSMFAFNAPVCYPAHIVLKNNNTAYKDSVDLTAGASSHTFSNLQFGSYAVAWIGENGDTIYRQNNVSVSQPDDGPNPYSISVTHYNGFWGNNRAAAFTISKPGKTIPIGTVVTLEEPDVYNYAETTTFVRSNINITTPQTSDSAYFYPGAYRFKVTDGCSGLSYFLDIIVNESDVYVYNWSYTDTLTCGGKQVTPTGTVMYQGIARTIYFQLKGGPTGSNDDPVPNNTPLLLAYPGTYIIVAGAINFSLDDYGSNSKVIQYDYTPLQVDINKTYGWVCPGLPADSGYIRAKGIHGRKDTASVYTYKLAAAGQGVTGPYLATNTTGEFSTSASGGAYTLTKNQNYDIWIGDECGASVVQTVKVVDFTTAQVATADQAEYCLGDAIHFSVINLPASAIIYEWTGPDGFTSNEQNPDVDEVTPASGGNYHVKISADICNQPIEADVNIILAAYVTSCYSAVTDTSVNPYAYGLLGNWRPSRSYTYYSARAQSDPDQPTNIRKDGAFNDFMAFWKKETNGWKPQHDNANWVWNAETTVFNKKGFELENKDPLGRYNAGIYGYDNAVPIAVIQNSRYCESAYEGFEDYGFGGNLCDDACPAERRFYLSGSDIRLDSTEKHTGRYSLRVVKDDSNHVALMVPVTATATDPSDPVFNKVDNDCAPYEPVLKSVKADKSVLIPPFSLLSGKKVLLSAWVKEAQDCKCTAYTGNQIKLVVKGSSGSVAIVAHPSGAIIDGWQRYEQVVDLPAGTDSLSIILQVTGNATTYFDDIRLHPYNANMKSFVYDPKSLRLMAELDENNYATFYEYDDDGTLTRLKKETERGIKTIRETRSALIKEPTDEETDEQQ